MCAWCDQPHGSYEPDEDREPDERPSRLFTPEPATTKHGFIRVMRGQTNLNTDPEE